MQQSLSRLDGLPPEWVAFFASALLSLLAIATGGTLNRDGMLYVDAARLFQDGGWRAAQEVFAWPFLPVLMTYVARITGLSLETAGYALNILFMAGTGALLVACAKRLFPEAVWPTLLVLLAIPGLNDYRHEVLREYGCWFFIMLSFWLALRWAEAPRWRSVLVVHGSLGAAALFRPEALALFPALILWQASEAPASERWRRLAIIGALPVLAIAAMVAAYLSGSLSGRLAEDLGRFSPERFVTKAHMIAQVLPDYAHDQTLTILLFGSLAIIPIKFVKMMSVFCIPFFLPLLRSSEIRETLRRSRIFPWAFGSQLVVLMVFVTNHHFLAGRYMAALLLFAVPFAGFGFWLLLRHFPRWKMPLITLTICFALSNVISLTSGKQHFVSAGAWLGKQSQDTPRVYNESSRAAYYAGWRYKTNAAEKNRSTLIEAVHRGDFDLIVLEVSRKEADFSSWFERSGLQEVARFSDKNGDSVVIAKPAYVSERIKE